MLFQGNSIRLIELENGIAEFQFNSQGSVNTLDQKTFTEFKQVLTIIEQSSKIKGLLITSAKETFIVGADINEFLPIFALPESELLVWIKAATDVFDRLEDLPIPTVAAVNGFALGGGCEFILSCDYRIADTTASIGLPEVTLGIFPGFGGTVRLSRLIGVDNAALWISTGKMFRAPETLHYGMTDGVVEPENLRSAAITTLQSAIAGKLNWQAKRKVKLSPLTLNATESLMTFNTCKGMIAAKAGKHYPAPMLMIKTIEAGAHLGRAEAMAIENQNFIKIAKTEAATAQVGLFLADQILKSKAKQAIRVATKDVNKAAVIGAGIMGGGIAYQSAYKGIPIVMKDLFDHALDLGMSTAAELLTKLHERGRLTTSNMAKTLANITPSLSYEAIKGVDLVVEAVVESPKIKSDVLVEVERVMPACTILTSNTSTISIDLLAKKLRRKDKFCGMHFFNPVHKMPLVEVIRGRHTSDETVASVVAYASRMGKSAIVVNDCPGFYVNRVLFPYLAAFSELVLSGANFEFIDQVMEKDFGWPMGPGYLLDVVGIDTAEHCTAVMAQGFPTRMKKITGDPVNVLFSHGHFGQKNNRGFYQYQKDKRGKVVKQPSQDMAKLFPVNNDINSALTSDSIIDRLMIPMVNEVIRCLEEGVVSSAAEADMGLIYGLGFPPFRGGPIRYLETLGLDNFIERADKLAHLGEVYQVTDGLRDMAAQGLSYFSTDVKQPANSN